MHLFFKKSFTNSRSDSSTFLFLILYRNLLCVILSNIFLLFKLNNNITLLFVLFYIIYIFFIISCKAIFVNFIDEFLFRYLIAYPLFRRYSANISIQLILIFCSIYREALSIDRSLRLNNFFYRIFVVLL